MYKIAIFVFAAAAVMQAAEMKPDKRLQSSAEVIREMMGMPERGIPQRLLDKSQCIVIVPGLKKGAFVFGGQYGRGFASCRKGSAGWGSPAAVRIEGGSFGLQLGGQST